MVQMPYFEFILWLSSNASVAILLFIGYFASPCDCSYGFYMLLCIAVQPGIENLFENHSAIGHLVVGRTEVCRMLLLKLYD